MAIADTAAHFRRCLMSIAVTTPTAARTDPSNAAIVLGPRGSPGSRVAKAAHAMVAINTAWMHSNTRVNRTIDRTIRVVAIARAYDDSAASTNNVCAAGDSQTRTMPQLQFT